MKTLGNLIWLLCGGVFTACGYLVSSIVMMITIIGIPFGFQTLKLASLALWPFGKTVMDNGSSSGCLSLLMNIIWICVGGFWICLSHFFFGALHHHHRHPVRKATFQIGCFGTLSIRERYSIINRNLFNLNRTTKE